MMAQMRMWCLIALLSAGAMAWAPGASADLQLTLEGMVADNAVMAPIRPVFQFLGHGLQWDAATRTIRLEDASGVLSVTIGSRQGRYLHKASGETRMADLDTHPRYVGTTGFGPLTSMWRLAGISYVVDSQTRDRTEFTLGDRRLIVTHPRGVGRDDDESDEPPPGLVGLPGGEAVPQMTMKNTSGKQITLTLWKDGQEREWKLPPQSTVGPRPLSAGTYRYKATAAGVRSKSGRTTLEAYHDYTWTWSIITSAR